MPDKKIIVLLACTTLLGLACMCIPGFWLPDTGEEPAVEEAVEEVPAPPEQADPEPVPTEPPQDFTACSLQLADVLRTAEEAYDYGEDDFELDEELVLVTYQVSGDQILSPEYAEVGEDFVEYQNASEAHDAIWDFFVDVIPASQRGMVSQFEVFTDGYSNDLGAVEQMDDPRFWSLSMDIVDSEDFAAASTTLVHEFGHLLTLNNSQVDVDMDLFENPDDLEIYEQAEAACGNYFLYEGCSRADSYINLFFWRFWPDLYEQWLTIDSIEDDSEYEDAIYAFYEEHPGQFVNDYAATNPEEDIAESWTYFIFTPKPAGDTVAEEKILFFYEFPELVELRGQILEGLCTYVEE